MHMQNINYVGEQDLRQQRNFERFIIKKTPWAHLDIAGMAFSNMEEH